MVNARTGFHSAVWSLRQSGDQQRYIETNSASNSAPKKNHKHITAEASQQVCDWDLALPPLRCFYMADVRGRALMQPIYQSTVAFLTEQWLQLAGPERIDRVDARLLAGREGTALDVVVGHVERRQSLLKLALELGIERNDPRLRSTLDADQKRLSTSIQRYVLEDPMMQDAVLGLESGSAQTFLDALQTVLDEESFLLSQNRAALRQARRLLYKLSEKCHIVPSGLFIHGVLSREDHPSCGGGFGDVYRASYANRPVALKHMRHFLHGPSSDPREKTRFLREALVWRQLRHPHILPFLGLDKETFPASFSMVSPWMENGTVMKYLEKAGKQHIARLVHEIALGLQYLHSQHVVHGDLRGANILISSDHRACLADFGLSVWSNASTSMRSSTRAGSLYWMAPELIDPDRFSLGGRFIRTPASDIYAFGCTCVELYAGKPPFGTLPPPAVLFKTINGERLPRESAGSIPDELWTCVSTCWSENPSSRPHIDWVVERTLLSWEPIQRQRTSSPLPQRSTRPLPAVPQRLRSASEPIPSSDHVTTARINAVLDYVKLRDDCAAASNSAQSLSDVLLEWIAAAGSIAPTQVARAVVEQYQEAVDWQGQLARYISWIGIDVVDIPLLSHSSEEQPTYAEGLLADLLAANDQVVAALELYVAIAMPETQLERIPAAAQEASLSTPEIDDVRQLVEHPKPLMGLGSFSTREKPRATESAPTGDLSLPWNVQATQITPFGASSRDLQLDGTQPLHLGKAIRDYNASTSDPNCISFQQGDFLDVLRIGTPSNPWLVRKSDGSSGSVPPGFLSLVV
ncbi:Kinase-like protein [Mycena chlorophos]|uniref:mitogen-activated protein kinase kinase kinase n=1 Tax=Mycena chlorophos TaxID=658473 RepID=A0A8H6TLX6_MYCCL|nr:Kinase-like protein [Mycena chlorophos]